MKDIPATFVDIEEFAVKANDFYERAKSGERIFVTVGGKIEHEVFTDMNRTTNVFDEMPRPELTPEQYETLLDILDPLE